MWLKEWTASTNTGLSYLTTCENVNYVKYVYFYAQLLAQPSCKNVSVAVTCWCLYWRSNRLTSCIYSVYLRTLTQLWAEVDLPTFKPPIPGRQTGARIRPLPLPLHVQSPCTVSSPNSGIVSRNQGFILVIRGMTLEGRIVLTGV